LAVINKGLIKMRIVIAAAVSGLLLVVPAALLASDHVDGLIAINNPVADISDLFAFPSPERPARLVLILNSYPFVSGSGHFSDQLVYSLLIRPVAITGRGQESGFSAGSSEYRFDCVFETPHEATNHWVDCTTPAGANIRGKVNQEAGIEESGVRLFAGHRSDPFLFSSAWFGDVVFNYLIPPADVSNDMYGLNVLSLVLELDLVRVFKAEDGRLFSVAGEIRQRSNSEDPSKLIDRVGRPEISNGHLVAQTHQEDLREYLRTTAPARHQDCKLACLP
jgi:hypothetical protein